MPQAQKKLSEDDELKKIVFDLKVGKEKEEQLKGYIKTAAGQKKLSERS